MARNGIETRVVHHDVGGLDVTVQVSPCSWMYASYGLQLQFQLPSDRRRPVSGHFVHLKKPWLALTTADYDGMVAATLAKIADGGTAPCPDCGETTWNHAAFGNAKLDKRCAGCLMKALDAEAEKARKREEARQMRKDGEMEKAGYTHRVDAWVHPEAGDDRPLSWYVRGKPTNAAVRKRLGQLGSVRKDDFAVVALSHGSG